MPNHSAEMIENWKQCIDIGKLVDTIAIGLSKVLHSLSYGVLIAKLSLYGVHFKFHTQSSILDCLMQFLLIYYLFNVIVTFTTVPMTTAFLIVVRQLIPFEIPIKNTLLFLWTSLNKILLQLSISAAFIPWLWCWWLVIHVDNSHIFHGKNKSA